MAFLQVNNPANMPYGWVNHGNNQNQGHSRKLCDVFLLRCTITYSTTATLSISSFGSEDRFQNLLHDCLPRNSLLFYHGYISMLSSPAYSLYLHQAEKLFCGLNSLGICIFDLHWACILLIFRTSALFQGANGGRTKLRED